MSIASSIHPLELCLARIFFDSARRRSSSCGVGVIVSTGLILTCAHVVSNALGLSDKNPEMPKGFVSIDFPFRKNKKRFDSTVVFWDIDADLAGLRLEEPPPPDIEPIWFIDSPPSWGNKVQTFGFPANHDKGTWAYGILRGPNTDGWIEIVDPLPTGHAIQPGFSGGPVWDETRNCCIGIVVAAEKNPDLRVGYLIPIHVIIEKWPELRAEPKPPQYQIQNVPLLLPYMVNRQEQENSLSIVLQRFDPEKPLPFIVIVHGNDKQAHDMFLERLYRADIPKLLKLPDCIPITSIHVQWPIYIRTTNELKERFTQSLAKQVLDTPMASIEEIQNTLARYSAPVMIDIHLLTDDWVRLKENILDGYMDFWERWPQLDPHQYLFIFLFLTHKTTENNIFMKITYSLRRRKILDQLSDFSRRSYNRIIGVVLPELSNISRTEAEDWVRNRARKYCTGDLTFVMAKIRDLYNHSDNMPMETLAQHLRSFLMQNPE